MNRRSAARLSTSAVLDCRSGDRWDAVLVDNLSTSGCKLQSTKPFVKFGDEVRLHFSDSLIAEGAVVWQDQRAAGIQFLGQPNEAIVAHLGSTILEFIPRKP